MTGLSPVGTLESSPLNSSRDITSWIEELRRADQTFYNLMTLEIWSLAQTMDELQPGFWADYMRNRQAVVHQYIQERRRQEEPIHTTTPQKLKSPLIHQRSPLHPLVAQSLRDSSSKRVSSFSTDLEQDLPKVTLRSSRAEWLSRPPISENASLSGATVLDWDEAVAVPPTLATVTKTPSRVHPFADSATPSKATLPTPTTTSIKAAPTLPISLIKLPHLMRFPVVKALPSPTVPQTIEGMTPVAIACWSTRNFLVPAIGEPSPSVQKRSDSIMLEPGQTIICQLGFQLSGLNTPVQVQLVKSLQDNQGLVVTWIEPLSITQVGATSPISEAMVQLTNQSSQPLTLKAGQAFCRLEFVCPSNSLSGLS